MKFYETKKFKELQRRWYDKLAASGFHDIERNETHQHTDTASFQDQEAIEEFYTKAADHLWSYAFLNLAEKAIWFLYANGNSIRNIAKGLGYTRSKVGWIIEKHTQIVMKK